MWHSKPRQKHHMFKLRRSPKHGWPTLPWKRPRTLPSNGKRMLWLAQRWHDCGRRYRCHYNPCWVRLVLGIHLRHIDKFLAIHLAIHDNYFRRTNLARRAPQTKTVQSTPFPPTLNAAPTGHTDSFVVPLGEQNPKTQHKDD
jgi:hypothetical protein